MRAHERDGCVNLRWWLMEILVVGGGIAGLTFGVAARRSGLDVSIVEQLPVVTAGAAGIGLHLNAQRALAGIGAAQAVEAVATKMDGYRYFDTDERPLGMAPYEAVWGAPTWAVHRADLNAALRAGLNDDQLAVGLGVTEVHSAADGIEVSFSDGSSRAYDLVVGADGVHSVVRACSIGPGRERYGGACFWRTTLPEQIVNHGTGVVGRPLTVGLIPLVRDRTHAFFQMLTGTPPTDAIHGRAARIREHYSDMGTTVRRALHLLPDDNDIHFGVLEWIEPPTWGTGRVVLIGDAAHSMAPPLALGAAMAIEDAIVLVEELAKTDDLAVSVSRFIARREPRVAFVRERTRITWERANATPTPGEPTDSDEFDRRNFLPLLEDP
jgi:2-polyprenyl-6-methoxyphenol hydroxylase-like FAD-dependent oxidoreductase